jgi:hypothetical protein
MSEILGIFEVVLNSEEDMLLRIHRFWTPYLEPTVNLEKHKNYEDIVEKKRREREVYIHL